MKKQIITNIRPPRTPREGMDTKAFVSEVLDTIRCCGILSAVTAMESPTAIMTANLQADTDATFAVAQIDLVKLNTALQLMLESLKVYPSILRVARERIRQNVEEHHRRDEDQLHKRNELILGAIAYLMCDVTSWPWNQADFKPTTRIRDLEKAAALIMAEIDRIQLAAALAAANPNAPKDTAHE